MPQVDGDIIRERARRLREAGEEALRVRLACEIGVQRQVLMEGASFGRTEHFMPVKVASPSLRGDVRALVIAGSDGEKLLAA
jgi:threonylcarbamoyladenosine tRNA methylthiotransferase MtaB